MLEPPPSPAPCPQAANVGLGRHRKSTSSLGPRAARVGPRPPRLLLGMGGRWRYHIPGHHAGPWQCPAGHWGPQRGSALALCSMALVKAQCADEGSSPRCPGIVPGEEQRWYSFCPQPPAGAGPCQLHCQLCRGRGQPRCSRGVPRSRFPLADVPAPGGARVSWELKHRELPPLWSPGPGAGGGLRCATASRCLPNAAPGPRGGAGCAAAGERLELRSSGQRGAWPGPRSAPAPGRPAGIPRPTPHRRAPPPSHPIARGLGAPGQADPGTEPCHAAPNRSRRRPEEPGGPSSGRAGTGGAPGRRAAVRGAGRRSGPGGAVRRPLPVPGPGAALASPPRRPAGPAEPRRAGAAGEGVAGPPRDPPGTPPAVPRSEPLACR